MFFSNKIPSALRFLAGETQECSQDYSTNFASAEKLLTPGCLKREILNQMYMHIYNYLFAVQAHSSQ